MSYTLYSPPLCPGHFMGNTLKENFWGTFNFYWEIILKQSLLGAPGWAEGESDGKGTVDRRPCWGQEMPCWYSQMQAYDLYFEAIWQTSPPGFWWHLVLEMQMLGAGMLLLILALPGEALYKRWLLLNCILWQNIIFMPEYVLRYMGLGMGKVYGTICGYYIQVKMN